MAKQSTQENRRARSTTRQTNPKWSSWFWYAVLALWLVWMWQSAFEQMRVQPLPYGAFKQHLKEGRILECVVKPQTIEGLLEARDEASHIPQNQEVETHSPSALESAARPEETMARTNPDRPSEEIDGPNGVFFRTVRIDDPGLVAELDEAGVEYWAVQPNPIAQFFWSWILPIGLLVLVWLAISRWMGSLGAGVMSFGKNRAKVFAERATGVTFDDVAGCDEAKDDLEEVVEFLKNPKRYEDVGANIPKGVLLVGPPGTGKTLLAKAVAGEANVTFFSISGSDFVEMFVGVGAARVRDLFTQAKSKAPCIVFIDEIDAIGRQRGVHVGAVNDEREQTLNQLLVEMDGFESNTGVIILAATNRPEVLDRALLRPGRFDRQVVVDTPDLEGRVAILEVHVKGKQLEADIDLRRIAQATAGFSGADLANAVNEAALLAVRRRRTQISQADLEDAVEKVIAGPERRSRRLNEEEKRRVAFHEVGHALVAAYSDHADPVQKISIVPRGRTALGYTLQLPTEEQFLMTRSEISDKLAGLLGGRAAEEIVFGEVSTGAQNDLERATALARQMVCIYGMGEKVGLVHCARNEGAEMLAGANGSLLRDCSEETARDVDQEVKELLQKSYDRAKGTLVEHRAELERIATHLLKAETIDAEKLRELLAA